MGFFGRLLGGGKREEKSESSGMGPGGGFGQDEGSQNGFSQDNFSEGNLSQGFMQDRWNMPEKPVFGDEPGMGNQSEDYGSWHGRNDDGDGNLSFGGQRFNENVQVKEIDNYPGVNEKPTQNWSDKSISKDLEIISSKLDAIKSSIESLDHRVKNLERIAEREQKPKRPTW